MKKFLIVFGLLAFFVGCSQPEAKVSTVGATDARGVTVSDDNKVGEYVVFDFTPIPFKKGETKRVSWHFINGASWIGSNSLYLRDLEGITDGQDRITVTPFSVDITASTTKTGTGTVYIQGMVKLNDGSIVLANSNAITITVVD